MHDRFQRPLVPVDNAAVEPMEAHTVPLSFAADDAAAYERLMGRWSRRLAVPFLDFAAIGNPPAILDVGCGTGSLTLALADAVGGAQITGIDLSQAMVDHARSRTSDRRLKFERGMPSHCHTQTPPSMRRCRCSC
jgi:trans-aconitate methyltransferase